MTHCMFLFSSLTLAPHPVHLFGLSSSQNEVHKCPTVSGSTHNLSQTSAELMHVHPPACLPGGILIDRLEGRKSNHGKKKLERLGSGESGSRAEKQTGPIDRTCESNKQNKPESFTKERKKGIERTKERTEGRKNRQT
mmetsp:Transcript_11343/g.21843  ORF Transcript_11343/g.21843 Transcript_11343/m.21843 type:complete len:138 (-) Transcript_11343:576-989(-)